jgi:hypothetical protein
VEEEKRWRIAIEKWMAQQAEVPNRKQLQATFPQAPMKVIRSVLQSTRDKREG